MSGGGDPGAGAALLAGAMVANACVNEWADGSGGEARNAATLTTFLDGVGLDVEVVEPAPGRSSVVARLAGRSRGAPAGLVLQAGLDVWPVDEASWSFPPFAGDVVDGVLRGRGSLNALGPLASMAVALRALAADGFRPDRDLTLVASADSHHHGRWGTAWLAEHRRDLLEAESVVVATGGPPVPGPSGLSVPVLVADRGAAWLRLRVRGEVTHPAEPAEPAALALAARAVAALDGHEATGRPDPVLEAFVERSGWSPLVGGLLDPVRMDEVIETLPFGLDHHFRAVTRPTIRVTALRGGGGPLLPGEVVVDLTVRGLIEGPGPTAAALVRAALDGVLPGDAYVLEEVVEVAPSSSGFPSPLWDALAGVAAAAYPGSAPVPFVAPEPADAWVFRGLGACCYHFGLYSSRMALPLWSRGYGPDEQVDVASLALMTRGWLTLAHELLG